MLMGQRTKNILLVGEYAKNADFPQNEKYDYFWRGPDKCDKIKKFLKSEISSGGQNSCEKLNFSDF